MLSKAVYLYAQFGDIHNSFWPKIQNSPPSVRPVIFYLENVATSQNPGCNRFLSDHPGCNKKHQAKIQTYRIVDKCLLLCSEEYACYPVITATDWKFNLPKLTSIYTVATKLCRVMPVLLQLGC